MTGALLRRARPSLLPLETMTAPVSRAPTAASSGSRATATLSSSPARIARPLPTVFAYPLRFTFSLPPSQLSSLRETSPPSFRSPPLLIRPPALFCTRTYATYFQRTQLPMPVLPSPARTAPSRSLPTPPRSLAPRATSTSRAASLATPAPVCVCERTCEYYIADLVILRLEISPQLPSSPYSHHNSQLTYFAPK